MKPMSPLSRIWRTYPHSSSPSAVLIVSNGSATNNTDCACPDQPLMTGSSATDRSLLHVPTADVYAAPLPCDFHVVMSPFAAAGPSILNQVGWQRWQGFAAAHPLIDNFDAALAEQRLIWPAGAVPQPAPTSSATLTAWMHVTNACNLDCPYCYVRKSSQSMHEKVGTAAIQALFRTAQARGFRHVKVKYAGGEATLHMRLVRRLHDIAFAFRAQLESS